MCLFLFLLLPLIAAYQTYGSLQAAAKISGGEEMVKFSKQLEAQLIPEWKGAFVNYRLLKKDIKKIKLLRKNESWNKARDSAEGFSCSKLESVIEFLKEKTKAWLPKASSHGDAIQVRRSISASTRGAVYETVLIQLFEQADAAKAFFARLDAELNKVNEFYKRKEAEFLERGETLKRQTQILIDLKAILNDQGSSKKSSSGHGGIESGSDSSRYGGRSTPSEDGSVAGEKEGEKEEEDVVAAVFEKNGVTFVDSPSRLSGNRSKTKKGNAKLYVKGKSGSAGSARVGNTLSRQMRVDIPATTPSLTVSAITQMLWEDLVQNQSAKKDEAAFQGGSGSTRINKKKMQHAEKMIRGAFVELYKGLGLLKTYSSLNMVAFGKILKKFDKVSEQQAAPVYLKAVEKSYFNHSDKAVKLADDIESTFIQYFMEDDRKKAMKFLRPREKKDSHAVTLFIGIFTGFFLALFVGYAILAHLTGLYRDSDQSGYVATLFPIFSTLVLFNLHLFLYGCNIYMWRSTRINYSFIFEFSPGTELTYRDVFLICSTFMTVVLGGMVAHITLRLMGFPSDDIDSIPALTLLVSAAVLFCPINIIYRSSRFCFLRIMRNILLAPLYKVVMTDFFMADQLTSQIPLLRNVEYVACYYLAGNFATHAYGACDHNKSYRQMAYVISFLPYYSRAMQCARRWFEEGDLSQLANLGKYVSAMIAAGARLSFANQPHNDFLLALVVITSTIATIYQLYWDFVKDWGLLKPRSKNPWLRDELIIKQKTVYFLSMALNFVLRLAWVQTVMHLKMTGPGYRETPADKVTGFVLASLEVIRRGHWNFYRLENEHLNNVGKFRAVKTVPLPFREVDSD